MIYEFESWKVKTLILSAEREISEEGEIENEGLTCGKFGESKWKVESIERERERGDCQYFSVKECEYLARNLLNVYPFDWGNGKEMKGKEKMSDYNSLF